MALAKTPGVGGLPPGMCTLLIALTLVVSAVPEARQNASVEITTRDGKVSSQLAIPQTTAGKVPVVVFITGTDEISNGGTRSLARVLAAEGIASIRYSRRLPAAAAEGDPGFESEVADAAAIVSFLRNDIRFSTITVAGDPSGSAVAAVAARVARADTATTFAWGNESPVTTAVRDLELPGSPRPRRNTGQRASLRDTTIANIEGARISIEYGRPSKRGRVIWGNLVKWGGWWMPGADEATTLTTNRSLSFGTLVVPAGDYTLYTHPADTEFVLIINRETGQFHTVYHPEQDLGRVAMTKAPAETTAERMTFTIEADSKGGGILKLSWDDRTYSAAFTIHR